MIHPYPEPCSLGLLDLGRFGRFKKHGSGLPGRPLSGGQIGPCFLDLRTAPHGVKAWA